MSRIVITESDFTVPVATYQTTDVVFVPGFSVLDLSTDGAAQQGEPKYCASLADFSKYFGTVTPTFAATQTYPAGFDAKATAGLSTTNWFDAGAADPSFIYAKELLAQGIPVVYERMNISTADITVAAAYSYLTTLVFTDTRTESVSYPTATVYSSTSTYSIGDIVSYTDSETEETNYYRCLVDITEGEAFTPAHWQVLPKTQDTLQPLLDLAIPVKYLTSGGYQSVEFTPEGGSGTLAGQMITMAEARGDCVALVDYLDNATRKLVGDSSVYDAIKVLSSEFATAFVPWVEVSFVNTYGGTSNNHMPPSFAYLTALGEALGYSSNTQAIAGVTRGQIPNFVRLCTNYTLTNTIAEDTFQPESGVSVNGITNIANYGYRIWGNRTMKANSGGTKATSFLNIRNMVSDIKKTVYNAGMLTLFEPNAQVTWLSFTSKITPFLDSLISNYGLSKYTIERNTTTDTGSPLPKTTLSATITIYPVYSIEKITVQIAIRDDDTVEVTE